MHKQRRTTNRTGELVYLEWVDSAGYTGWQKLETLQHNMDALSIKSVGWIVAENQDILTIVPHISPSSGCGDLTIPKAVITKCRIIKSY